MDTKIKIIDTHCHPQLSQYDSDRDEVIERALKVGVGMICVGVDLESSIQAIVLSARYEGLWASVGLHPNDNLDEMYDQSAYEKLAADSKVIAIGEVGLDYYRTTELEKKEFQKKRFLQQMDLATRVSKPLIIHCRDAHEDMLSMISGRGLIHSFTGTTEQASIYIEKGFYIGLNGIVTFSDDYREMVRSIPTDRLILETDSPYLAPAPHRGKRNEPAFVEVVGNQIAAIRGVQASALFKETTANVARLFNIDV